MKKINNNIEEYQGTCLTYYIDDKKKVLIDAGVLINKKIDLVIITHCHYDHITHLKELKDKLDCKIACSIKEKQSLEQVNEKSLSFLNKKRIKPVKVDLALKHGDIIKTGEYEFEVIETPGHTEGSISLFENNKKILFSGDAWFGDKAIGRWDLPSGNKEDALKSVDKLKKLNAKIFLPGHNYRMV